MVTLIECDLTGVGGMDAAEDHNLTSKERGTRTIVVQERAWIGIGHS
jgi:hypothetical protein